MANLHLSVIAVVLFFNLPGSARAKSQWILETHHHSDCWWQGEFLLNCSFTRISTIPEAISQTATTADFSYNNIRTFLCTDERNEKWMLKHLNLSNNLISELSLTTCTYLPVLETLNLNGNAIHTLTLDTPMPARGSTTHRKVDHLLPALKILSVERNNLNTVPRGLGLLQSLQTVRMASNSIRQIEPQDFQNCSQLKDIDLQNNNKITKIHPDAFRDLNKLQVVKQYNHYFNVLITIKDINYNIQHDYIALIIILVYNYKNESKWDSVLLKTALIPTGSTSVLNCNLDNTRGNGVSWWTPKGRISENHSLPHMTLDKMNNLVIHNAEKTAEGIYLCIFNTTKENYLIYNLQVKERVSASLVRKARDTNSVFRQGRTESDLALAVSLSVLITFVCAFCLGAFARPYLVSLWRLMHGNKNSGSNQIYTDTCPTESSTLHERVTSSGVHPLNPEAEHQNPSNMKKKSLFSDIKTNIDHYQNANADDNGLFSVRTDYQNSNEVTPRQSMSNDIALWKDSTYAKNKHSEKNRFPPIPRRLNADPYSNHTNSSDSDLAFMGETNSPFSTTQTRTVAQDSRNSRVSNNSGLEHSEMTKATPDSPERKDIVSHNEPMHTTKFKHERQSRDEQLGLNSNTNMTSDVGRVILPSNSRRDTDIEHTNMTSDVGDVILPNNSRRDTDIENSSTYLTVEGSPFSEYDCERVCTNETNASADVFGDSSSDEGTLFTMSDCSSLADSELEQPVVSDNMPVCQLSLEEADANSETVELSTPPESPNIVAELQYTGENEDENSAYYETIINHGSDATTAEPASPYADKCSDHVSMSDPDTVSSSSQEVPGKLDYFTNAESTLQTPDSDSLHNQSTDFGNMVEHSPTYDTDIEESPEEAEMQLYQLPTDPQHSLSFSATEQKENAPEENTDEHIARNSSEKNSGEALRRTLRRNMSTSEDNDFIFAPFDTDLNEIVKNTSLLHSNDESSLQSLPERTAEKHFRLITQQDDLLPQGKEGNTTKAWADKMHRGFEEENCDGYTEIQDTSKCSPPEETQPCNLTADLLQLCTSGKTQAGFTIDDHFQLDQSDEDTNSFSVPQDFFSESTRYSSHSFPQKPAGNTISDSSKTEDDITTTELENNSTTAGEHLQNSSEALNQKSQTNLRRDQFFVKKKRAFDGFANILQSRTTNFDS
ncbi:PREDICTED: leucine-rich repeat-containing protein 66 [Acanthisitta chloris]|uniref:leucine-rich repeat-containing protein 66 n=1 Tax=Acanthisitta chloris TaxID=57068 RepID=UPI0004F0CC28|nr:PREDICTED: leucine-rich repeat-containing protein 66 [Acanthisitta chloris]